MTMVTTKRAVLLVVFVSSTIAAWMAPAALKFEFVDITKPRRETFGQAAYEIGNPLLLNDQVTYHARWFGRREFDVGVFKADGKSVEPVSILVIGSAMRIGSGVAVNGDRTLYIMNNRVVSSDGRTSESLTLAPGFRPSFIAGRGSTTAITAELRNSVNGIVAYQSGQLKLIAKTGDVIAGTSDTFKSFARSHSDGDAIAFVARTGDGTQTEAGPNHIYHPHALFRWEREQIAVLCKSGDACEGRKVIGFGYGGFSLSGDAVAITAGLEVSPTKVQSAVVLFDDGKLKLIDDEQDKYGEVAASRFGVAFCGEMQTGEPYRRQTVWVHHDGVTSSVIRPGDHLFDQQIDDAWIGPDSLDDEGNLAFCYFGKDHNGIALARPERTIGIMSIVMTCAAFVAFVWLAWDISRNRSSETANSIATAD